MIDASELLLNLDLTSLFLNLAGLGVMITVFILFYTRSPRYFPKVAEELKSWVREELVEDVKSWAKEDLMPTGLAVVLGDPNITDEDGKPLPGMLDVAIERFTGSLLQKAKTSAMGQESGFSRRLDKTRTELVGALIPGKWKAALSLAGLDSSWIEDHSEELLQLAPEIAPLVGGMGGLVGGEGPPGLPAGPAALPSSSQIPTMKQQ